MKYMTMAAKRPRSLSMREIQDELFADSDSEFEPESSSSDEFDDEEDDEIQLFKNCFTL